MALPLCSATTEGETGGGAVLAKEGQSREVVNVDNTKVYFLIRFRMNFVTGSCSPLDEYLELTKQSKFRSNVYSLRSNAQASKSCEQVGRGGRVRGPRRGNDERVDKLNGQGNDQGLGAKGVNGNNILPTILAHVGNQGNVGNQNGNVVNKNVQENVGNVLVNDNRVGCSYKEFLTCNPKEYDGKGGVVVLTRWIEKMKYVQDMSGCSIGSESLSTRALNESISSATTEGETGRGAVLSKEGQSLEVVDAATILQISSAIRHISNIDNMYIKSYSFSLFSSLPVSHSLWSSQSFGHQKAINGFDMPLPVAVCSGLVNPLAPRKGKFHGGLMTMSTLCT
ncbi:hypothetical protein Tco_0761402 [Tanacetum coccineum]